MAGKASTGTDYLFCHPHRPGLVAASLRSAALLLTAEIDAMTAINAGRSDVYDESVRQGGAKVVTSQTTDRRINTDPTSNLPFNLVLSAAEVAERSKVALPYVRDGTDEAKQRGNTGGLFFEDCDPEFSDDDPDADLDM